MNGVVNAHPLMVAPFRPGCEQPEGRSAFTSYVDAGECRPCMVAMIASAVNVPGLASHRLHTTVRGKACVLALDVVREYLDEFDPLRVRAERALLPLVAASWASP